MSATTILNTAPLGALIRYTDNSPKPPARFTKKLAAWERSNGVGRLVKKEPPRPYPTWTAPASFTPHEGNFSSDGVILVTIMRTHSADSALTFEVAEEPQPGQVRVLLDFGGCTELLHLAESVMTCHGIFPPPAIRVRPTEGTDNEAIKIQRRADHRHPGRA